MASAGERHPRESEPSFRADSKEASFVPLHRKSEQQRLYSLRTRECVIRDRVGQLRHNFNIHGRCLLPREDGERCETDQDGGDCLRLPLLEGAKVFSIVYRKQMQRLHPGR